MRGIFPKYKIAGGPEQCGNRSWYQGTVFHGEDYSSLCTHVADLIDVVGITFVWYRRIRIELYHRMQTATGSLANPSPSGSNLLTDHVTANFHHKKLACSCPRNATKVRCALGCEGHSRCSDASYATCITSQYCGLTFSRIYVYQSVLSATAPYVFVNWAVRKISSELSL